MEIKFEGYMMGGNPFDVIVETYVQLLRQSLFDVLRIGTDKDGMQGTSKPLIERINTQREILNKMTPEQIEMCRNTSILYTKAGNLMEINNYLFELEQSFRTVWCECQPKYDDKFEKEFIGEESSEYIRRRELTNLVFKCIEDKDPKEFERFLAKCIDVIDPVVKTGWPLEAEAFVEEHKLSIGNIEFMRSVLKHYIDDKEGKIEKLFDMIKIKG